MNIQNVGGFIWIVFLEQLKAVCPRNFSAKLGFAIF